LTVQTGTLGLSHTIHCLNHMSDNQNQHTDLCTSPVSHFTFSVTFYR